MKFRIFRFPALPQRKGVRLVLFLLFASACTGLAAWLLGGEARPVHMSALVERADIERSVLASGVLQPIRKVDVGAQVNGQLKRLHVRLGQAVKKGDLLAEIDPQLAQGDLRIAEADLASMLAERRGVDARLEAAREEWRRQRALFADGMTAQRELQRARAELGRLEAERAGLDARLDKGRYIVGQQRTRLAYTRIEAPIDGEVLSLDTREGQTVIAAQQAPTILRLGDLSRIEVRAQVSEADIGHIRPGMKAFFTLLGAPDERYPGVVREIQPTPEKVNNAMFFNVLFDVDNPRRRLRQDMTAQVTLVERAVRQVPAIPLTALGEQAGRDTYRVQVLGPDGEARPRTVRVGLMGRTHVQVLQGLRLGERVVTASAEASDAAAAGDRP